MYVLENPPPSTLTVSVERRAELERNRETTLLWLSRNREVAETFRSPEQDHVQKFTAACG